MFYRYHNFSLRVARGKITDRLGDRAQRVGSVDDRRKFSCLQEILQNSHDVFFARYRKARPRQLSDERRERNQFQNARQAPENASGRVSEMIVADKNVDPGGHSARWQADSDRFDATSRMRS